MPNLIDWSLITGWWHQQERVNHYNRCKWFQDFLNKCDFGDAIDYQRHLCLVSQLFGKQKWWGSSHMFMFIWMSATLDSLTQKLQHILLFMWSMRTTAITVRPAVSVGPDSGVYSASHTLHTVSLTAGCFLSDLQSDFHAGPIFLVVTLGNRQQWGLQQEWVERLNK